MSLVAYYSQISYPVTIFIIPTLVLIGYSLLRRKVEAFGLFYLSWLGGAYLPWLVFGATVQHMTFNYYFLYTAPILDIGVVWLFSQLKIKESYRNVMIVGLLAVTAIFLAYYFPINLFRA